jgi:hypothetical protein
MLFLINPISARGHLDAYARLYSAALLANGHRVVLIARTDGGVRDYLMRAHRDLAGGFRFISIEEADARAPSPAPVGAIYPDRSELPAWKRGLLVWREEGFKGVARRALVVPKRALLESLSPQVVEWLRSQRKGWVLNFYRLLNADVGRFSFITVVRAVEGAQMIIGRKPDLVINLYLDIMGEHKRSVAALDSLSDAPWVGILFHPRRAKNRNLREEAYFSSRNARGAVFLVPEAIAPYHAARPHLNFALAPDVADLELALEPHPLAEGVRNRAGGRKIILQIGSITPHKGIMTLLDVIAEADPKRFFFALFGEVHWESFGAEQCRLRAFYAAPPENVMLHEGYIEDERDYNTVISACDIIYAVYENFNSSSNSLTKAAGLQRPILVSQGTLMGERVVAANLGLAVQAGDAANILNGIDAITQNQFGRFDYGSYARAHSLEQLKTVLADALPRWCACGLDETSSYGNKL